MKETRSSFLHTAVLAGLLLIGHSAIARGDTVTLEWDPVTTNEDGSAFATPPSPEDLTGYRLFQSTFSLLNRTTAQAMSDSAVTKSVVSAPNTSLAAAIPTDQRIYFRLTAFDASGNQSGFNVDSSNLDVQVSTFIAASPAPAPDTTLPTVSITSPANGALLSGSVTITGTASDAGGVSSVEVSVDNGTFSPATGTTSWSFALNTATLSNAPHTITVRAKDNANNAATTSVTITVDNAGPTVSIVSPAGGSTVSGTVIITGTASDPNVVAGIQFKINGSNISPSNIGAEDNSSPYNVSLNTLGYSNGAYTLTAVARDTLGNLTTSAGVAITINNIDTTPPTGVVINSPVDGGNIRKNASIKFSASDNLGIAKVELWEGLGTKEFAILSLNKTQTFSPPEPSLQQAPMSFGTQVLGYHTLQIKAYDAVGNMTASSKIQVKVIKGKINLFRFNSQGFGVSTTGNLDSDVERESEAKAIVIGPQSGVSQQLVFDPIVDKVKFTTIRGRTLVERSNIGGQGIVLDLQDAAGNIAYESGLVGLVCMQGGEESGEAGKWECKPVVVVR